MVAGSKVAPKSTSLSERLLNVGVVNLLPRCSGRDGGGQRKRGEDCQ